MSTPEPMACIAEECRSPLTCHSRGSCREACLDAWRSVAHGFEAIRKEGRAHEGWRREERA
jgi:hypothetical protein